MHRIMMSSLFNTKQMVKLASNSFGNIFRITTWGESHGKAIGVVIDGCPAGVTLTEDLLNQALLLRAPGRNVYTTSRKENDQAEIYSGVFQDTTTGAPISILIMNKDADSSSYDSIKDILRPGHANFTYNTKYGVHDHRGGGRASARETACRVAAGVVAKQILSRFSIQTAAYISSVAGVTAQISETNLDVINDLTYNSPVFCPDPNASSEIMKMIALSSAAGDSLGGIVEFIALGLPCGFGDPVYEKLPANLAKAMLSLPASKGFELGCGFQSSGMRGSEHNDYFICENSEIKTSTNNAGGTLGGISTGMPLSGRVAFKPTSSIKQPQRSVTLQGEPINFQLSASARHDPCVALRAVPVVDAMCALVLVDALLMHRSSVL